MKPKRVWRFEKTVFPDGGLYSVIPCRYEDECAKLLVAAKTSNEETLKKIADELSWNQRPTINAHDLLRKPKLEQPGH